MHSVLNSNIGKFVENVDVLVIDDNQFMRRTIRNLLINMGVRATYEAGDGIEGLEAIRMFAPDIVIVDWEMPLLSGPELVKMVRTPGVFPLPDVPIVMLTAFVERWRVVEANRLGVNEFLAKPVSGKALLERIVSIISKPRPMVRIGDYYGPEPRNNSVIKQKPDAPKEKTKKSAPVFH